MGSGEKNDKQLSVIRKSVSEYVRPQGHITHLPYLQSVKYTNQKVRGKKFNQINQFLRSTQNN